MKMSVQFYSLGMREASKRKRNTGTSNAINSRGNVLKLHTVENILHLC